MSNRYLRASSFSGVVNKCQFVGPETTRGRISDGKQATVSVGSHSRCHFEQSHAALGPGPERHTIYSRYGLCREGRGSSGVYNPLLALFRLLFFSPLSFFFPSSIDLHLPPTDSGVSKGHIAILPRPPSLIISRRSPLPRCKMTITRVQPNDHHHLQSIADLLATVSKIVTVTGAGISTNAGIPVSINTLVSYIFLTILRTFDRKRAFTP